MFFKIVKQLFSRFFSFFTRTPKKNEIKKRPANREEQVRKPKESLFSEFNLDRAILSSLRKKGYTEPTPIQKQAIPIIQAGDDLIALAETGSGKTGACTIPICNQVDISNPRIQTLIIVPTRELALQYAVEAQKVGDRKGVKAFAVYGGEKHALQLAKLNHETHVCIATPGRLVDFIYSRDIDLSHVKTLVLDEADEMLSMGFIDDIELIIQCLVHEHQTLLFSATMLPKVRQLAQKYMKDPKEVILQKKQASPSRIRHLFNYCQPRNKMEELARQIKIQECKQVMVFAESRIEVEKVAHFLKKKMRGVDYLHGGLNQNLRQMIVSKFRNQKISFLVATDVAARGLDFSHVTHVFLYRLPLDVDTYIHRSGRTGRVDRSGVVQSLVSRSELDLFEKIKKKLNNKTEWVGSPPPADNHKGREKNPRARFTK